MQPYESAFAVDQAVVIADRARLDAFASVWALHHPLVVEQLAFAGRTARVADVRYYHGGDVLYALEGVPGIWHECCLSSALDGEGAPLRGLPRGR